MNEKKRGIEASIGMHQRVADASAAYVSLCNELALAPADHEYVSIWKTSLQSQSKRSHGRTCLFIVSRSMQPEYVMWDHGVKSVVVLCAYVETLQLMRTCAIHSLRCLLFKELNRLS
jgi:hypothetical protein